jgi:hypothetical protein
LRAADRPVSDLSQEDHGRRSKGRYQGMKKIVCILLLVVRRACTKLNLIVVPVVIIMGSKVLQVVFPRATMVRHLLFQLMRHVPRMDMRFQDGTCNIVCLQYCKKNGALPRFFILIILVFVCGLGICCVIVFLIGN